jgi:hypothetical protein
MAMTKQDIEDIDDRVERIISRVLELHQARCPYGRFVETWRQRLIGVGIVAALIAAGSSAGTALILKAF